MDTNKTTASSGMLEGAEYEKNIMAICLYTNHRLIQNSSQH